MFRAAAEKADSEQVAIRTAEKLLRVRTRFCILDILPVISDAPVTDLNVSKVFNLFVKKILPQKGFICCQFHDVGLKRYSNESEQRDLLLNNVIRNIAYSDLMLRCNYSKPTRQVLV